MQIPVSCKFPRRASRDRQSSICHDARTCNADKRPWLVVIYLEFSTSLSSRSITRTAFLSSQIMRCINIINEPANKTIGRRGLPVFIVENNVAEYLLRARINYSDREYISARRLAFNDIARFSLEYLLFKIKTSYLLENISP